MSDFEDIFTSLRSERGVNRDSVISAIEAALLDAYTQREGGKRAAHARAHLAPAHGLCGSVLECGLGLISPGRRGNSPNSKAA